MVAVDVEDPVGGVEVVEGPVVGGHVLHADGLVGGVDVVVHAELVLVRVPVELPTDDVGVPGDNPGELVRPLSEAIRIEGRDVAYDVDHFSSRLGLLQLTHQPAEHHARVDGLVQQPPIQPIAIIRVDRDDPEPRTRQDGVIASEASGGRDLGPHEATPLVSHRVVQPLDAES